MAPPPEPPVLPGTAYGPYTVREVTPFDRGWKLRLEGPDGPVTCTLAPWDPASPAPLRRGAWGAFPEVATFEPSRHRGHDAIARLLGSLPAGLPPMPDARTHPDRVERPLADAVSPLLCTAPWTTLEIPDPSGDVVQCCGDWTHGVRGNATRETLSEIWNGEGYRRARRQMAGGPGPEGVDALCRPVCPRRYDGLLGERALTFERGGDAYVRNQRLLVEDLRARRETVQARPLYVVVAGSTYCNYDCIMCDCGRSPRRDLPASVWEQLAEELPTVRNVSLLGGEPLADAACMRFLRGWDRARHPDATVSLTTNGSLLDADTLAQLSRCRFGGITVSLNAGTAEVYAAVQRGLPFETVLRNLERLNAWRAQPGQGFALELSFVIQPENAHTLPAFGEIAARFDALIRLLPLSVHPAVPCDVYREPARIQTMLDGLDAFAAWSRGPRPGWLGRIQGARDAILAEVAARASGEGARRPSLPLVVESGPRFTP